MSAEFLEPWGYAAVFAGTLLEGETVLLLGGFAAHAGYLRLPWVIAVALGAAYASDLAWFWLGRRYGARLLQRFPRQAPRAARVRALLERHSLAAILALRFLYGLRIVGPLAIGTSAVPWTRFAALDLIAALAWASLLACAGYLFGGGLQLLLGDLRELELALAAGIAVLGGALWWLRLRHGRR